MSKKHAKHVKEGSVAEEAMESPAEEAAESGLKRGGKAKKLKTGGRAKKNIKAEGYAAKHNLGKPSRKLSTGGKSDNWISGATKNKGALHRELHVPEGEKIPAKKLEKAAHSSNPTERKRASLAKTLKSFH